MTTTRRPKLLERLRAHRSPAPPPVAWHWAGLYLGAGQAGPVWGGGEHHALVIGPPRAGKTTRLAVPNLLLHPGPAVATSTKADLAAATHAYRAARGTCWWWDPTGTVPAPPGMQPLRWSPVVGCETWDTAVARAHALAAAARPAPPGPYHHYGEAHWVERAQALLAPLLHATALTGGDLATTLSWLHRREVLTAIETLEGQGSQLAADLLTGIAATEERELSGIFSTADSLLAVYRTHAALASARQPNFDPAVFARSSDTLYLCAPATALTQHAPLVVALLDQVRAAAYATRAYPPMLWVLDELANIAPLPDLPATVSEGASQGLLVLACLQDLSQARARWGPAADGFLTLFTHKLVLPGVADLATLRQVSALAGEIDVPVVGGSRENRLFGKSSTTTNSQRRPLLPVDAVARGIPEGAWWLNRTHVSVLALPAWR